MKEKILITRPIWRDIVDYLEKYFEVEMNQGEKYTKDQLKSALKDKAGMLVAMGEKVDSEIAGSAPGLRAVCVSAAGYNNLDLQAITRLGIIASNAPGPTNDTVADFAWGLIIATARRMVEAEHWLIEGNWKGPSMSRFFGTEVHGKTLGIIGMGRIGQSIAKRGFGFDMKTLYHNRRALGPEVERRCGRATYMSKTELLGSSDFVVLALPYSNESHHIIGKEELNMMKPSAFLVNISRGGLVDEAALAEALRSKKIAGAGIDVFEKEPVIFPDLLGLPNLLLTPHIAGGTEKAQHGLAMLAAENLVAALGYGPQAHRPPSILNPEVLSGK